MPNLTPNLKLNTWLENDVVDFEEINENFQIIDGLVRVTESGTKAANYTAGSSGTTTWRYKKYSDGTIDMSAKLEFANLKCNTGTESPYYSGTSTVMFPFTLSSVYDVQMHLASNTVGWVSDIMGHAVNDKVLFRVMSVTNETNDVYKQVFINVKGVLE